MAGWFRDLLWVSPPPPSGGLLSLLSLLLRKVRCISSHILPQTLAEKRVREENWDILTAIWRAIQASTPEADLPFSQPDSLGQRN